MPRYFIDLIGGVDNHTDDEGSDLPGLTEACRETSGMLPRLQVASWSTVEMGSSSPRCGTKMESRSTGRRSRSEARCSSNLALRQVASLAPAQVGRTR